MTWLEALLLGLVQGLTEFIPVSSSGHLVLGRHLLGADVEGGLTFEIFVHLGTIFSILTVYWHRSFRVLTETLGTLVRPDEIATRYRERRSVRFGLLILVTMVPTGLVYLLLSDPIEATFTDPRFASGMLLVTGTLLLLTVLRPNPEGNVTPLKALVIGVAQSAALLPGISRSGATICTALYQKVAPKTAADFSFLMLLPVVIGASLIDALEILGEGLEMGWLPLLVGTLTAYVSGVVAIKIVLDVVEQGNLQYFAYYCFAVGGAGLWLL